MRFWRLVIWFTCGGCALSCSAQYRILPGNLDTDGLPVSAAHICLGSTGTEHCYTPPNYMKDAPFGLDPQAKTVGKLNGQDLTLFTATFSGGGSGLLTSFALLAVKNNEFTNLLPKVWLTDQSEYKVWNLPEFSSLPILLTADFVWDFEAAKASNYQEETHFAAHRYKIEVFVYDPKADRYTQRIAYTTSKKYPGLDEVDTIRVLDEEKTTILAKLRANPSSK